MRPQNYQKSTTLEGLGRPPKSRQIIGFRVEGLQVLGF